MLKQLRILPEIIGGMLVLAGIWLLVYGVVEALAMIHHVR